MMRTLVTWIGKSDLDACDRDDHKGDCGPVCRLLNSREHGKFDEVHILSDMARARSISEATEAFCAWLSKSYGLLVAAHPSDLNLRNDYGRAYEFTDEEVCGLLEKGAANDRYAFLLSPGYPAAQAAMLLIARFTVPNIALFNTSRERGVERVTMPFTLSIDRAPLGNLLSHSPLRSEDRPEIPPSFRNAIVGESNALENALQHAYCAADHNDTVLLLGETGTGKDLFAHAIHGASGRQSAPFVALNIATAPETLVENELFGHVKGAFTGATDKRKGKIAQAEGGVLFLDEIGDLKENLQVKLLRFLEDHIFTPVGGDAEKRAHVRIIAATNRDLRAKVRDGSFRRDLYERLALITVFLPPLRDRGDDVGILARVFLDVYNRENGTGIGFEEHATRALKGHLWPGNVRELKNLVRRLAILSGKTQKISEENVKWAIEQAQRLDSPPDERPSVTRLPKDEFLGQMAAVIDELIRRFSEGDGEKMYDLPFVPEQTWGAKQTVNLLDRYLKPLLYGRALKLGESKNQAGKLVGLTQFGRDADPACELYVKYFAEILGDR